MKFIKKIMTLRSFTSFIRRKVFNKRISYVGVYIVICLLQDQHTHTLQTIVVL